MANDVEFWKQDPVTKVESIMRDVERLARRSRAAGLAVTAYILELAVEEARKDADIEATSARRGSSSYLQATRPD
jgi:hypothetical protein